MNKNNVSSFIVEGILNMINIYVCYITLSMQWFHTGQVITCLCVYFLVYYMSKPNVSRCPVPNL